MRNLRESGALALALVVGSLSLAAPAHADDPNDPTMTPQAIARDRAEIRRLNNQQLAYVQRRDAQYAQGWRDYAEANGRGSYDRYAEDRGAYRRGDASRQSAAPSSTQREYARALADWRADVAACRAGDYDRCAQR